MRRITRVVRAAAVFGACPAVVVNRSVLDATAHRCLHGPAAKRLTRSVLAAPSASSMHVICHPRQLESTLPSAARRSHVAAPARETSQQESQMKTTSIRSLVPRFLSAGALAAAIVAAPALAQQGSLAKDV